MNRTKKAVADDEILSEYDFSAGVRGKYYQSYRQGSNIVLLDHDIAEAFPDAAAVNEALRMLIKLARKRVRTAAKPVSRAKPRRNPGQRSGAASR